MNRLLKPCMIAVLFTMVVTAQEQRHYQPSPENIKARNWFQEAKMGLFIHWGLYSMLAGGGEEGIAEWIMQTKGISARAYEKLPQLFNPVQFDAKKWVSMAKEAGMKYITITTKHHDGFAMYDSGVSDYNIVKATPFGRDIFRELEQECKKQGIKLFAYYSQLDWHHPDYFPRGWTGRSTGRPESGNWEAYLDYQNAQIKELAENYEITGFWFDGWWDQASHKTDWHKIVDFRIDNNNIDWNLDETYRIIHQTKPQLLIGNNHHEAPFPGEDFQMFEKDLPGENTTGFGTASEDIGQLPLETCETINGSWGFNLIDNNHKSLDDLIRYVVKAAGSDANFLLNVGPMPDGRIQREHIDILKKLGKWMELYGETIYNTRGGPVIKKDSFTSTQRGKTIYIHLLNSEENQVLLENLDGDLKHIRLFKDKTALEYKKNRQGTTINIPIQKMDSIDTIIEIILE
ncbi:alpha-L-fucosidase [Flagellimonas sp. 2504JD4-2]